MVWKIGLFFVPIIIPLNGASPRSSAREIFTPDCGPGLTLDATGRCVPQLPSQQCPYGTFWNAWTGQCNGIPLSKCPVGLVQDATGNCVPGPVPCPIGQVKDRVTGQCVRVDPNTNLPLCPLCQICLECTNSEVNALVNECLDGPLEGLQTCLSNIGLYPVTIRNLISARMTPGFLRTGKA